MFAGVPTPIRYVGLSSGRYGTVFFDNIVHLSMTFTYCKPSKCITVKVKL